MPGRRKVTPRCSGEGARQWAHRGSGGGGCAALCPPDCALGLATLHPGPGTPSPFVTCWGDRSHTSCILPPAMPGFGPAPRPTDPTSSFGVTDLHWPPRGACGARDRHPTVPPREGSKRSLHLPCLDIYLIPQRALPGVTHRPHGPQVSYTALS